MSCPGSRPAMAWSRSALVVAWVSPPSSSARSSMGLADSTAAAVGAPRPPHSLGSTQTRGVSHVDTAVDVERLPSHVVAIDNEVADGPSYFLWRPNPAERYTLQDGFLHLVRDARIHLRLDEAGTHRVDRHAVARQLERRSLGETDDARLRGRVVCLPKVAHLAHEGADVDDPAALLRHEVGQRGLHRVKAAIQIGTNDGVPVFDGQIFQGLVDGNPRIVDYHIDPTKLLPHVVDTLPALSGLRDIPL